MNFNTFGNLDGGIVPVQSINDIENFFVNAFPNSKTRKRNFDGFLNLLNMFKKNNLDQYISKYWIDGSFTSQKLDPNDIDLIVFLNGEKESIEIVNKIMSGEFQQQLRELGLEFYCDSYYILDIDTIPEEEEEVRNAIDYQTSYWMGKFGFDRNKNPKGIIELINNEEVRENAI